MACLWFGVAALMWSFLNVNSTFILVLVVASLLGVAVGIPALRDPQFRNPAAMFLLSLGAFLTCVVVAVVVVLYFLGLLLSSPMSTHR